MSDNPDNPINPQYLSLHVDATIAKLLSDEISPTKAPSSAKRTSPSSSNNPVDNPQDMKDSFASTNNATNPNKVERAKKRMF